MVVTFCMCTGYTPATCGCCLKITETLKWLLCICWSIFSFIQLTANIYSTIATDEEIVADIVEMPIFHVKCLNGTNIVLTRLLWIYLRRTRIKRWNAKINFDFIQLTAVVHDSVAVCAIIAFGAGYRSLSSGLLGSWANHSERLTKFSWWAVQFNTINSETETSFVSHLYF